MEESAERGNGMKIGVIGLGYIGLPTALLLGKNGHEVFGYDIVKDKIEMLNKGELPFEEKGLKELLPEANFKAVDIIEQADAFIVAVPTPLTQDKKCDLSYVEKAMESLVPFIKKDVLVILESTVKPGTTESVVKPILEKSGLNAGSDFHLSYVAEKAIPGNCLYEMINNDRIIGSLDEKGSELTKQLYSSFVKGQIHVSNCTTGETVKLIENAYRDVNIAFANELAKKCEKLNVNVWEAIELANKHPRVNVHRPGPGVGGHCISIDPWFLIEEDKQGIIEIARSINDTMPEYVVNLLESMLKEKNKIKIALLGAAYKKNVDDARESPTEKIAGICKGKGWEVKVTDPFVKDFPERIVSFDEAVDNADAILILVDHDDYKERRVMLKKLENKTIIFDTRNLFNGEFRTLGNKNV